jgi:predicted glutamine amidotransferase
MCIAILNRKSTLAKISLENSFANNNQGCGMLWNQDGKMQTFKTYNHKAFMTKYYEVRKQIKTPIVLHYRIATSGFSKKNLHPFKVNSNLGFVHNGVIFGLGNNEESDTFEFNEILKKLGSNFLKNKSIMTLIESFIEKDKLIFLDSSDVVTIVNEKFGSYDKLGNWFSNTSYKQINKYVWAGNKKKYAFDFEEEEEETQDEAIEFLKDYYNQENLQHLKEDIYFDGFNTYNEAYSSLTFNKNYNV